MGSSLWGIRRITIISMAAPPWSGPGPLPGRIGQGAGVGVGILRGSIMFIGDFKESKIFSSTNTKIPRRSKTIQKYSFLNMFDFLGFTYVLRFSESQRFIKIPPFCITNTRKNKKMPYLFAIISPFIPRVWAIRIHSLAQWVWPPRT